MDILIAASSLKNTQEAIDEVSRTIQDSKNQLILAFCSVEYDVLIFQSELRKKYPQSLICGVTTCLGVMTNSGVFTSGGTGLGLMSFANNGAQYSVGLSKDLDPFNAGKEAARLMMESSHRIGELPDFLLVFGIPGSEEKNLEGVQSYFGKAVPAYGGSAADNTLEGKWKIFNGDHLSSAGLIVVGFFLDDPRGIISSFHCGYFPTEHEGKVTKSEGRTIHEINGRPAVEVYNEWTNGALRKSMENNESVILSASSLFPIARKQGAINNVPLYLLSHPHQILQNGAISLFTTIANGESITLMNGTIEDIELRAANVVKSILNREGLAPADISGAFIVFCAGCMLTLLNAGNLSNVVESLSKAIPGIPFLGIFTYGEQGCLLERQAVHGNLMISVTIFKKV